MGWDAFEVALRRQHRPRWVWRQFRRECTCGQPLPCLVLAEVLADVHRRSGRGDRRDLWL